jgi:hypothetical protein
MGQYRVGLLIGRAFALANGRGQVGGVRAVVELRQVADGDRVALDRARERFLRFLRDAPDRVEDQRALRLLDAVAAEEDAGSARVGW